MNLSTNIVAVLLYISVILAYIGVGSETDYVLSGRSHASDVAFCPPDSLVASDSLAVDSLSPVDSTDAGNLHISKDSSVIMLVDSVLEYGKKYLGLPYVSGHAGPKSFDCSGFTSFVYGHFGYTLNRTSGGQLADGWKVIDNQNDLLPGDLVFYGGRKNYRSIGHVGIVVENFPEENYFTFIHATVSRGVIISKSNEKYYIVRYIKGCRVLPEYY